MEQGNKHRTSSPTGTTRPLDHILKYTGVFGGVQGLSMLVSVVRNKLASWLLGQVGFALVSVYNSIGELVSSTSNFGIPFSAVRHVSELQELGASRESETERFVLVVRTWCVWTALLAVALLALFSPVLASVFSDTDIQLRASSIIMLAPMVASMAITGGEISILKGTHRLKRVASISALGALSAFVCTIPFYWLWKIDGIVIALDVSTVAYAAINLAFTIPVYPWRISPCSLSVFKQGLAMIRLGVPYVMAAVAGSGVGLALPALFVEFGQMADVGLYRAAFMVMGSYAGIVFTALEADYFPRLSSVNHDAVRRNATIDQQVRVCVLIIAPLLILMMIAMPLIINILFAPDFKSVAPIAICAALYPFSRALTLPMGYTALACGHSLLYLCMEIIYDLASLVLIAGGYYLWGLVGAGLGLSAAGVFDLLLIGSCYGAYYHIRLNRTTLMLASEQATLVVATILACMYLPLSWHLPFGILLLLASFWLSWNVLSRESAVIEKLIKRFHLECLCHRRR